MRQERYYALWMGALVWLACASDICLALPMLLHPNAMLARLGLPQALERPMVPQLAAALALAVCVVGLSACVQPARARLACASIVATRWAYALLFSLLEPTGQRTLTVLELAFALFMTLVFLLLLRTQRALQQSLAPSVEDGHAEIAA